MDSDQDLIASGGFCAPFDLGSVYDIPLVRVFTDDGVAVPFKLTVRRGGIRFVTQDPWPRRFILFPRIERAEQALRRIPLRLASRRRRVGFAVARFGSWLGDPAAYRRRQAEIREENAWYDEDD
jgi:hypothetical protein